MTFRVALLAVGVPVVIAGALAYLAIYVSGVYGLALFFAVPLMIGWLATALLRIARGPRSLSDCLSISAAAALVLASAFLVVRAEGLACILMALPLSAPMIILGSVVAYSLFHRREWNAIRASAIVVTIVLTAIAIEPRFHHASSAVVADSILVRASPRETWRAIVALDRIPQPHDWIYRLGVACPQRTRIVSPATNGLRVCTMSTGVVVEQIEVWRPEAMLRWRSQSAPPPMKELNPFADVDPPHLHGYYEAPRGEFALAPAATNMTILTRRTWYTQELAPAYYWRWWCELAINHVHRTVLEHVRDAAESKGARS